ncbi:NAC domain-containing protein 41 [Daucus carota subsp. sativus]|uniref:NAC domain-containing protein 41 n=1 Tax=Daucus carota subsp. sativus TaxID=79200 RepID=UPI0007EFE102|nr:PREDICTED: NAC domain-containing protein 41 [Daucus carota subsp. sativus]
MEKNCIVGRNGEELQLPVGFRFRPTDEELILYYLMPKAQSLPLPAAFIPQIDEIFQSHPSHLPGDVEQRRYYFCKRSWDYSKTCRSRINYISNESSYWKQAGKERAISVDVAHRRSIVVGTKKLFVLYEEKQKTSWCMQEYRLLPSQFEDFDNWVAYRVYQRKRNGRVKNTRENTKKMDVAEGVEMMSINNATEVESSPLPSPLCSSNDEETFL